MNRRKFLAGLTTTGLIGAGSARAGADAGAAPQRKSTSGGLPRKVVIGTVMQSFWGTYPGLPARLDQLSGLVDQMAAQAKEKYGRGVDLAVLPEVAITGELGPDGLSRSVEFAGPVQELFARKAREHRCYIVVPSYFAETNARQRSFNAAYLVGRQGEVVGHYRKVHLVVSLERQTTEGGASAGDTQPVFNCDFGKLGIQICYDMEFDDGWEELARQGAELIAWPTQSPQTSQPAFRAKKDRCYIVSSTWRHNASIFEPTGKITAQIKPPQGVLVDEIDLSYALLPWSSKLQNGRAFQTAFGDKAGFHYYEDEDCGIFWSNDPKKSVGEMARSLGLLELEEERARVRQFYRRAKQG
jgi:predicted amidohydrolase